MDGIIFRTTDGARWGAAGGSGTGGNLTPLQFDENMWELLTRVQAIENDPPEAVGVNGFTVIGSQFQVNMTDGSTRGPYDLPIAAFRDVGIWVNNLPLLVMDFFQVPGRGYYRTLIAHTTPDSPAVFDPNAIDEDSGSPTFGQPLYSLVLGEDASIYDVGFFMPGRVGQGIAVGEEMFAHTFVRDVTMPLDLPGSLAKLAAACAADMELEIYQDTTLQGSVTFAAGETDGVFVWTTAVDFAAGETLSVHPPATLDATARGLKISFKAVRNDL